MKRFLSLFVSCSIFAMPAQVILITHAEPTPSESTLSLRGRERAAAYIPFFKGSPDVNFNGLPSAIFASSHLTALTVQPLASDLEIPVNSRHTSTTDLAQEILTNPDYEGHTVLICRPAAEIPTLAKALGVKKHPKKWSEESHDRLWVVSFNELGEASFQNLPQKLLYGDSK